MTKKKKPKRPRPAKPSASKKRARKATPAAKSPAQLIQGVVNDGRRRGLSPTLIKVSPRLYETWTRDKTAAEPLAKAGCNIAASNDLRGHLIAIVSFSDYSEVRIERPQADYTNGGVTIVFS